MSQNATPEERQALAALEQCESLTLPVSGEAARAAIERPAFPAWSDDLAVLGGNQPEGWGPLMQPVRKVAVRLMKEGRIVILRKGRPVDPDDFRGTYRLALPPEAET